jgi:hypothetical protein
MLHNLHQAAINGANRLPATNVLTQLFNIINYIFDFRKKISANMEGIQILTACMATYGIDVTTPQVVLMLITNFKVTARKIFGCEF